MRSHIDAGQTHTHTHHREDSFEVGTLKNDKMICVPYNGSKIMRTISSTFKLLLARSLRYLELESVFDTELNIPKCGAFFPSLESMQMHFLCWFALLVLELIENYTVNHSNPFRVDWNIDRMQSSALRSY